MTIVQPTSVLVALACAQLLGCGPSVTTMRLVSAPAKSDDCSLQFLQLTINQVSPAAPDYAYEVLGHVILQETGVQDPLQDRYRKLVRPSACAMGGDAVAILQQATSSSALGSGSGVDYAVVRKKQDVGAPRPPTSF